MPQERVDNPPHRPGVDPAAAGAQEQGGAAGRPEQPRPALGQPALHGPQGGQADRHGPLLRALAEHPQRPGGPGRRRRGRARTARRPGSRSRRAARGPPGHGPRSGCRRRLPARRRRSSAAASSWRSTPGRVRPVRGVASRAPGSVATSPSRAAQAVKPRAAAARRASVVRAIPRLAWPASQLRSTSRSRAGGLVPAHPPGVLEQRRDVAAVGAHRVLREPALGAQVPGEALQRVREGRRQRSVRERRCRPHPHRVAHGRHGDPRWCAAQAPARQIGSGLQPGPTPTGPPGGASDRRPRRPARPPRAARGSAAR